MTSLVTLKTDTAKIESECSICLDKIGPGSQIAGHEVTAQAAQTIGTTQGALEQIEHALHDNCLKEWLKKDNSCPICRRRFKIEAKGTFGLIDRVITVIFTKVPPKLLLGGFYLGGFAVSAGIIWLGGPERRPATLRS